MTKENKSSLLSEVATYYTEKLKVHGETPHGVDWNSAESQSLRFEQLCKIISIEKRDFSLNDLGCGYGALLEYLHNKYSISSYLGIDVSKNMILSAESRQVKSHHAASGLVRFLNAAQPDIEADYGVASGIFNVRLSRTDNEWYGYLQDTLDELDRTSRFGFAFNCLTSYSDEDKKRDYLYYADPCKIFDLCKRRYSRQVALLHDYELYEFTILVRKL